MNAPHTTAGDARVRSGVPGLDELLGGGLLPRRTVLVKGAPGSGKTTLGLQMLVAGATAFNEPGALISFEQRPEQIFEDAARMGWDLPALAEAKRVSPIFVSPEQVMQSEGRQAHALLVDLADLAEDRGVCRVLIDSLSHLGPLLTAEEPRLRLLKFLNGLKSLGITPILTSELGNEDGLLGLEAYLVDTVLVMEQDGSGPCGGRWIQVYKGRGLAHLAGRHPLEIGPGGIEIFPHSYPSETGTVAAEPAPDAPTLPSGIAGIDDLLGGGYTPGSVVMVAGLSGTFKTTVASRFLIGGGGEPGLWISFQETLDAITRRFGREAVEAGVRISVLEAIPGRQPVEKLLHMAAGRIAETGARRVVLDGLAELTVGQPDAESREEAVRWFLRNMRALGVTTLATEQLTRVASQNPMSSIAWPEQADTIIYLGLVEIESRLERVISVLKHRGGAALGDLRGVAPGGPEGLVVSDRFVGLSGVLGGSPLGRRKAQIEEIFQPLYFIRDFLEMARSAEVDAAKRDVMLQQLTGETQRLIDLLARHFDEPAKGGGK